MYCLMCIYMGMLLIPSIHSAIRVPGMTCCRMGKDIRQRRTAIAPILMTLGDGDMARMAKETFRMNTLTADPSGEITLARTAAVAPLRMLDGDR